MIFEFGKRMYTALVGGLTVAPKHRRDITDCG